MHGSRAFGGPFHATLRIINRCNVKCSPCPWFSPYVEKPVLTELKRARLNGIELDEHKYGEHLHNHLQQFDAGSERLHGVLDELLKMGTRRFIFTGTGEPFLHKNLLDFIGRVKSGRGACIVHTNGTLLSPQITDEMVRLKVDELRVTTMAGTREMYLRTHQGTRDGTFEAIRDNLLYLAGRKASVGTRRPVVTLVNVVHSLNYDGLLDFGRFAGSVNADRVCFQPLVDDGDPGLSKLVPTEKQAFSVREQLSEAKSYFESHGIGHNINYFLNVFRAKIDTIGLYRVIPCYIGWLGVHFQLNGDVHPCCRCYDSLGNIYETKFHDIWHGHAYRDFRQHARRINRSKSPGISGCDCGSCPHYTLNIRIYRHLHPIDGRLIRFGLPSL